VRVGVGAPRDAPTTERGEHPKSSPPAPVHSEPITGSAVPCRAARTRERTRWSGASRAVPVLMPPAGLEQAKSPASTVRFTGRRPPPFDGETPQPAVLSLFSKCPPRARGAVPVQKPLHAYDGGSSPRPRGCSGVRVVVPIGHIRPPRARGAVPFRQANSTDWGSSSPRLAGLFPLGRRSLRFRCRPPRARGAVPTQSAPPVAAADVLQALRVSTPFGVTGVMSVTIRCRNVADVSPGQILAAVGDVLAGTWAQRSARGWPRTAPPAGTAPGWPTILWTSK
jgi:hypothetical protein